MRIQFLIFHELIKAPSNLLFYNIQSSRKTDDLLAIVLQGAIITIFSVCFARNFAQRFGNCQKCLHKHVFAGDHSAGSIVQITSDS